MTPKFSSRVIDLLETSSVDLKLIFLSALCDWMNALSGHSFATALDLVDFCFPC